MNFLFDSNGKHIANLVNEQLHSPYGSNVGHFVPNCNIFIDMHGRYLGEIIYNNRLMYNINSPYISVNYGNNGNYGNPGNQGNIGIISGYRNIETPWL